MKTKKTVINLFILLLIGISFSAKSQYTVQVGTGTISSSAYPFNNGNGYTRIAAIYDSTEIDTTGVITTLAWRVKDYNSNWAPVKIYLKSIPNTTLIADTWSNMISGATLVVSTSINFPNYGWKNINITPFTYSSGNLLVLVETNYGNDGTTTASFNSTNTGYNETWYNNYTPPTGVGAVNVYARPNIRITFTCAVDTSVSQLGYTLTANATSAIYQWIDCNSNQPISGETNQSFTATSNGNYAVQITQNGCTDTSPCYNITGVGITENTFGSDISIYPNPTNDYFTFSFTGEKIHEKLLVSVYNTFGQMVLQKEFNDLPPFSQNSINIKELSNGIYCIIFKAGNIQQTHTIIVAK